MNIYKGRLLMLAEKIENPEETPSFVMWTAARDADCTTPGCVAGWTLHYWGNLPSSYGHARAFDDAGDLLGLVRGQWWPLFMGAFKAGKDILTLTRQDVAAELRRLAASF